MCIQGVHTGPRVCIHLTQYNVPHDVLHAGCLPLTHTTCQLSHTLLSKSESPLSDASPLSCTEPSLFHALSSSLSGSTYTHTHAHTHTHTHTQITLSEIAHEQGAQVWHCSYAVALFCVRCLSLGGGLINVQQRMQRTVKISESSVHGT